MDLIVHLEPQYLPLAQLPQLDHVLARFVLSPQRAMVEKKADFHPRTLTPSPRSIHLCQFPGPSSISDRVAVMRKLNVCTSAGGKAVRRRMAR